MPGAILIVSGASDLHGLAVRRELARRGRAVHYLVADELRDHQIGHGLDGEAFVRVQEGRIDLAEVSTIWWRRPRLNQRDPGDRLDAEQLQFVNRNCIGALRAVLVAGFEGTWVSSPDATERVADKLYQLRVARQLGFRVPDTLLSNDPEAVRAFHRRHGGDVIVKAAHNSGDLFLATQRADLDQVSDSQISAVPSFYQELIPGTRHLRVNCFGDEVHAAMIETEALDWRPDINVPISAHRLDGGLEARLRDLLRAFDLRVGIMDLKVTDEGEVVWFEVNPQGQFLFLEPLTGQELLDRFTTFLETVDERSPLR